MNALDFLTNILSGRLSNEQLKYCLVKTNKQPFRVDNLPARPNNIEDFVSLEELCSNNKLERYAGVGISIQASNICAIDVDHCFKRKFDETSGDERAAQLLKMFEKTYCEFSFSGTGLRILFRHNLIDDYSDSYYIKNEKNQIEFYQPNKSFRYVTITGVSIKDNNLLDLDDETVYSFLNEYMKKPEIQKQAINVTNEDKSLDELLALTKYYCFKNMSFQDNWFNSAPGSGKDESERDYKLIAFIYENITQDKELIKQIFETSPFFKSKDFKHMSKWTGQNYRYYNYLYECMRKTHI